MKSLIVVSIDTPGPDELADVVMEMNPPQITGFDGEVRLVVGEDVPIVIAFLDDGTVPDAD